MPANYANSANTIGIGLPFIDSTSPPLHRSTSSTLSTRRFRHGFTLVELLVVIDGSSNTLMMAEILLPALDGSGGAANRTHSF